MPMQGFPAPPAKKKQKKIMTREMPEKNFTDKTHIENIYLFVSAYINYKAKLSLSVVRLKEKVFVQSSDLQL